MTETTAVTTGNYVVKNYDQLVKDAGGTNRDGVNTVTWKDSNGLTKEAGVIGDVLQLAENQLFDAIEKGSDKDVQKAQVVYEKAKRMFAALSDLVKAGSDLLMRVIGNIK